MTDWFSRIVSGLFHPLLMPTYGMLLIFSEVNAYFVHTLPYEAKQFAVLVVFLNTFLLPVVFLLYLIKRKQVTDLQVSRKEERWLPLLFTTLLFTSTYYILKSIHINPVILLFVAAGILSVITAFFINLFWKISIHMVGIGGLIGTFYGLGWSFQLSVESLVIWMLLAAGITGFARVHMQQHTVSQVLAGWALGFTVALVVLVVGV